MERLSQNRFSRAAENRIRLADKLVCYFLFSLQKYFAVTVEFFQNCVGRAVRDADLKRRFDARLYSAWIDSGLANGVYKSYPTLDDTLVADEMKSWKYDSSASFESPYAAVTVDNASPKMAVDQQLWRWISNTIESYAVIFQSIYKLLRSYLNSYRSFSYRQFVSSFQKLFKFSYLIDVNRGKMKRQLWRMSWSDISISHHESQPISRSFRYFIKYRFIQFAGFLESGFSHDRFAPFEYITNRRYAYIELFGELVRICSRIIQFFNLFSLLKSEGTNGHAPRFESKHFHAVWNRGVAYVKLFGDVINRPALKIFSDNRLPNFSGKWFPHVLNIAQKGL
jgi:hypothetical protein